jgi:hypothetical protein
MELSDFSLQPLAGLLLKAEERCLFRILFPFGPSVRADPGLLAPALKSVYSDKLSVTITRISKDVQLPTDNYSWVLGETTLYGKEEVSLCTMTVVLATTDEVAAWSRGGRKYQLATELLFPLLLPNNWVYRIMIVAPPAGSLNDGFLDVNLILE